MVTKREKAVKLKSHERERQTYHVTITREGIAKRETDVSIDTARQ